MTAHTKLWPRSQAPANAADYEALYHQELPRIYNFFRYRFGEHALAEDLTAITFEKAWRNRSQYSHDLSAFTTWLFTIARRVAIDHYRRSKINLGLDDIHDLCADEDLEELIQKRADLQRLNLLLAGLSDRDRELVALKYGAGLTNRAIAALTGLSESNVGVILYRVVLLLREEWEASHE